METVNTNPTLCVRGLSMDLCQDRMTLREGTPLTACPLVILKQRKGCQLHVKEITSENCDYALQPSNQKREPNTTK